MCDPAQEGRTRAVSCSIRVRTGLAVLITAIAASSAPTPVAAGTTHPDTTSLFLLGTGMPIPDPHAQGPAFVVKVGERKFLFDAGAGVMRQMTAAGIPVLEGPITAVFLTH